ncbi:MAG: class I SAM-dependent methyltransferase family protein [Candidatus Thorarchaeota archaeon]
MKIIPHRHRKTYHQFLKSALGKQIPIELLPRRIRILGHVAILWLDSKIVDYKEQIGEITLEYSPKIQSVLRRTDAIAGPFRQPGVELIAGSPETETVFKENQVIFCLDPMKVMFSIGNKTERLRMSKLGTKEFVVDMFAGVGQLSLPMAVHAKPAIIHAIEWNPDAFYYLKRNIQVNKVSEIIKPHFGDTRLITPQLGQRKADRVIMGLIQGTDLYLKEGIQCVRPGGMMHIHEIGPKGDMENELLHKLETMCSSMSRNIELMESRLVKTYNPRYNHFVLDVQVNGS